MSDTRPIARQVLYGAYTLEAYLQEAEKGGRTVGDLFSDIFDEAGNLHPDFIQLRLTAANELQVRLGQHLDPDNAWQGTGISFLKDRGNHATATAYASLDLVGYNGSRYLCHTAHTSTTSAPNPAKFSTIYDAADLQAKVDQATVAKDGAQAAASAANTSKEGAEAAATAANASKNDAQAAATTASTHKDGAAAHENTAKDWANKTGGAVDGVEFSAKHYAELSEAAKTEAQSSEASATTAASLAETYKNEAIAARDAANDLANEDYGVQISPGVFSARHWATEAIITSGKSTLTASETIEQGDFVSIWDDAGVPKARKARADDPNRSASGFSINNATAGQPSALIFSGINPYTTSHGVGAGKVWLSATPGKATNTPPNASGHIVQPLGSAIDAGAIAFRPGEPIWLA